MCDIILFVFHNTDQFASDSEKRSSNNEKTRKTNLVTGGLDVGVDRLAFSQDIIELLQELLQLHNRRVVRHARRSSSGQQRLCLSLSRKRKAKSWFLLSVTLNKEKERKGRKTNIRSREGSEGGEMGFEFLLDNGITLLGVGEVSLVSEDLLALCNGEVMRRSAVPTASVLVGEGTLVGLFLVQNGLSLLEQLLTAIGHVVSSLDRLEDRRDTSLIDCLID